MEHAQQLKTILEGLLVPDNATRQRAEAALEAAQNTQPGPFLLALLALCGDWCVDALRRADGASCVQARPETRTMAAVLLRRKIQAHWGALDDGTKAALARWLVASLASPPPRDQPGLAVKLGDLVATVSLLEAGRADFDAEAGRLVSEVKAALVRALGTPVNAGALEALVRGDFFEDEAFAGACAPKLAALCAASDPAARRRAVAALGPLLVCLPASTWEGASHQAIVEAYLGAALDPADEEALRSGLEALVDLATEVPKLFRAHASQTLTHVLDLITTRHGGVRALAVEFVVSLAESAPSTCRAVRLGAIAFVDAAVDACCSLLLEEDPDAAQWETSPSPEPELSCECGRELGRDALDRLARALRPEAVLPRAMAAAAQLLKQGAQGHYQAARAACDALAQLAEHLGDLRSCSPKARKSVPLLNGQKTASFKKRIGDLVNALLPFATQYPVACVRAAAWDALGQAAADLQPQLQDGHGQDMLPAVLTSIATDAAPRARACAARALLCFLDGCGFSVVESHLERCARTLAATLGDAPTHVREYAVAAAAALASAVESCFEPQKKRTIAAELYGLFAPALKPLAAGTCATPDKAAGAALRARSLECLALLGCEAGIGVFGKDASDLLHVVTRDYFDAGRKPEDDVERAGALKSVVRVASCLGSDFAPFLSQVVPPLLEAASGTRVIVEKGEDDSDYEEGQEQYVVRTEALAEQAEACNLVLLLAEACGPTFANYVTPCLEALGPVANTAISGDVRSLALAALPALVGCANRAALLVGGDGRGPLLFALDACLASLAEEDESEPLETAARAFGACLEAGCRLDVAAKTFWPLLRGSRLDPSKLLEALYGVLAATLQRRAVRAAEATVDQDYDEMQREADEEEQERDASILHHVGEGCGSLLKTHAPDTLNALLDGAWAQRLAHMAQAQCLEEDRRFAVYVVCDALEFGPGACPAAQQRAAPLVSVLLESCAPETPCPRRQAACYGLGMAAAALQTHFAPYSDATVQVLIQQMAGRPDRATTSPCLPLDDEDDSEFEDVSDDEATPIQEALVADNAASALGRVLHGSADAGAWALWVQYLPLLADCAEADAALTRLCAGIGGGSLPAPLDLVAPCLGRCAAALKQGGAHGTTARGSSMVEFDGKAAARRIGGALAALPGAAVAALDGDARRALQECSL